MQEYQQRAIEEKAQLDERLQKLRAFFKSDTAKQLPKREKELLAQQNLLMTFYSQVLGIRIANFDITEDTEKLKLVTSEKDEADLAFGVNDIFDKVSGIHFTIDEDGISEWTELKGVF